MGLVGGVGGVVRVVLKVKMGFGSIVGERDHSSSSGKRLSYKMVAYGQGLMNLMLCYK